MRNLKKILALVLALMMTLSLMVTANASSFTDADQVSDKYEEAVEVLNGMGIFQGTDKGQLLPQKTLSRSEASVLVYRVISGDVNDKYLGNYAGYAAEQFSDVSASDWYEPYVAYAALNGYIQGDGKGHFTPDSSLTGVQLLTILLRAVGYDVNGEFSIDWENTVTKKAVEVGIDVPGVILSAPVSREVTAEIIFQVIEGVSTVVYTPALGYYTADVIPGGGRLTTTLGWKVFGLTPYTGYVVGNQATGEAATKVNSTTYSAASAADISLTYTSDLDLFGHYVTGYYCNRSNVRGADKGDVFYLVDNSTSQVLTATEYTNLPAAVKSAVVANSEAYANFVTGAPATQWDYQLLITNSGAANKYAVVKVDLSVAQYMAINNYTTTKTVTLNTGVVNQTNISGYETLALGTYVNVVTVAGTNSTNAAFPHKYVSVLGTTTGKVTYVNALNNAITVNGTVIEKAGAGQLTYAAAAGVPAAPATGAWNFDATYVIYTNLYGDFVGAYIPNAVSYLKATYAYYQTNIVDGTIKYYVQGVDMNGQVQTVELAITATEYNALTCTKLTWGASVTGSANSISVGTAQDLVLSPAANGAYTIAHRLNDGHSSPTNCATFQGVLTNAGLLTMYTVNGGPATISATTVTLGANKNYFVDNNTTFYYVTGYGAAIQVKSYTGIAALLNGNATCVLPNAAVVKTTQVYNANIGSQNYHIDAVLIAGDPALTSQSALVYVPTATKLGTNSDGDIYDVYINGELKQVALDTTGVTLTAQTFYAYTLNGGKYVLAAATAGCVENYTLTKVAGTAYLYVNDASGTQYPITEAAKLINLTNVENVPTTAADLMNAAENNTIVVDVEIVSGIITNVYIVSYT